MVKRLLVVVCFLMMFSMTGLSASAVTTGQVNYYGEESSVKEESSTDSSSQSSSDKGRLTRPDKTPIRQSLLQASDSVNYFLSVVGVVVISIVIYQLKKP